MANQTMIGLDINCSKCKKLALHSVTQIEGIDSLTINIKESTLTVIGDADPACMMDLLRKKFRCAQLISFGPVPKPKPKEKEDKKKPDPPKPKCVKCGKEFELPKCCPGCERKCNPPCWASLCIQVQCCPPCWDCSRPYYEPPCAPNLIYPRQPRAPCWARSEIPCPPYCRPYAPDDVWYVCTEDNQKSCPLM